jgi:group I intron endonuclease
MGYIYMLVDKRNGKKYVGKHNGQKNDYWSSGLVPNQIAKKHGRGVFERVILEDNIENDLLNEREIYYIKKENSFLDGYNSSIGGDGGGHWIYTKTDEEIKKIANIKSEKLKGRVFSEETKKKMSESGKIKIFTKQHRDNIGKSVKIRGGYPHSKETKEKLSKIMSGRKNKIHSDYMKKNNPNFQKISIDGVIFKSIQDAVETLGISRSSIKYRLKSNSEKNKNWYKII